MEKLVFTPGQFVSLTDTIFGRKITRAYSIASPPRGDNRFELCLNRVKEGIFSPHLFVMRAGDEVDMKGPLGGFVPRTPLRDSIFVATGTGIAPIRSMVLGLLPGNPEHQFTLIFGVRHPANLLYSEEFAGLEQQAANFRFLPTVTRPDENWKGRTGRVQPVLFETIGERRDVDVYVCGLKVMVDDVRAKLKALGFDRKHIIYEKYD
jgi:CDP-4-dehydro-6-deoxyglucose reductase